MGVFGDPDVGDVESGAIRVLHVDDPDVVEETTRGLERADDRIDVVGQPTVADALDALAAGAFDCVVSGYALPERTGVDLLETMRSRGRHLPFVLFTAEGCEDVASEAISAGVTEYQRNGDWSEQYALLANRIRNCVERHRSRRALQERKRRIETLISNLPGVVYRCRNDARWSMEVVEGECEGLTGYPASALESGDVSWGEDVIHHDDRDEVWATVQGALDDGEPFEVTYRIHTVDGTEKWVWERGRRIQVDERNLLDGFITDVTEPKERERELQRQNERLEEFTSVVSHDLRNPLTVVSGALEMAERTGDQEHFDRGQRAVDRMEQLIDDLLVLARQGDSVDEVDPVDLERIVEGCWRNVSTGDATLRVDVDRTVEADRSRCKQLLENLFVNAIEHGGEAVTVGDLDRDPDREENGGFYVADDGPGIPEERRERVFESGFSTAQDGTGFGLAIVRRIVLAHGWEIDVTESEDGGARFDITGISCCSD